MASKTTVSLIDDLDGTPANQEVPFGLDGVTYVIDLSETNAGRLRELFSEYIPHARRIGGRRESVRRIDPTSGAGVGSLRSSNPRGPSLASQVRVWAHNNGVDLAARGRIPVAVLADYRAAQAKTKTGTKPVVKAAAKSTGTPPGKSTVPAFSDQPGRRTAGTARTRQRGTNQAKATGATPAPANAKRKTKIRG